MDFGTVVTALGIVLGICVILPIGITWLITRNKTNETNKRVELALAAIEKNAEINVEDVLKKINLPQKSLKERTLKNLTIGTIFVAIGLGCLCYSVWLISEGSVGSARGMLLCGFIPLFMGIAYIIIYFISRKELRKEIEVEETNLQAEKQ